MKSVWFVGDALKALRGFPDAPRRDAGRQLDLVQNGKTPFDFKPMPTIGKGV
jgi:phage-related protein